MELSKVYSPGDIETKWYERWERSGAFKPEPDPSGRPPFVIVIPPPNVTGVLHMGHALNNTVQDILIRWHRMEGRSTLWVPGTDHAGIATQNVVERKLKKEGKTRHDLGREKFIEETWRWKEDHGSTIIRQLKRLGASCDWSRERFTMDEGLSKAVREVFVRLYKEDLIYRGNRIINWCPRCHTALSDEEAPHVETQGHLYFLKYPIVGKKDEHITVATTRPETMLGDTAVAVNPKDERYQALHGKKIILPLVNRELPVVLDEFVDPDFGSGIVKVTPAHDPNDFEMGTRHNLQFINVMHPDGRINEKGGVYNGLDRFEARKKIVADLEEKGLLIKTVSHLHAVGHCYRCHSVVEPYLSDQWFVRMKPLAEKALALGGVTFYPSRWQKVYLSWMENIRDWCISRQIWWGHRIPVWYCAECGKKTVEVKDPAACGHCKSKKITQDPDVLDTWFSSWLWPFSTLGWPEEAKDLQSFYPTSDLVTAPDIIFFWVARMIMAGCWFLKKPPFKNVYIHGTVRTDSGQKMSKSLGNAIDPLGVIGEIGADALRFSIVMLTASGQDAYLSTEKFELGRNFTNKIWNASRFAFMNLEGFKEGRREAAISAEKLTDLHRWILTRLAETQRDVTQAFENYRFNDAATNLYQFIWNDVCDWYLELLKPIFQGTDAEAKKTAQKVLFMTLYQSLKLLHPFMPFVTEEINEKLSEYSTEPHAPLITSSWVLKTSMTESAAKETIQLLQDTVRVVRDFKSLLGLDPRETFAGVLEVDNSGLGVGAFSNEVKALGHLSSFRTTEKFQKPEGSGKWVGRPVKTENSKGQVWIGLAKEMDFAQILARLEKTLKERKNFITSIEGKLGNESFVARAPQEVIEKERQKLSDAKWESERLAELIGALKS